MTIRIPKKIDKTALLLFMTLLYPAISGYMRKIVSIIIPIEQYIFDIIIWSIVVICSLSFFASRLKPKHLAVFSLFALFVFFQWAFANHDVFRLDTFGVLMFSVLPAFFVGATIKIESNTFNTLYKLSVFVLLVSIIYSFYYMSDRALSSDNMDYAYKVLPAILIITSGVFIKDKRITSVVLTIISIVLLLALGTRGPILCFVVFVVLLFIKNLGFTKFTFISVALGIILSLFMNSPLYTATLLKASAKLENMGFSTRIIEMVLDNELSDANGRDAIKDKLMYEIREEPFEFRGIFSDRISTSGLVDNEYTTSYESGTYAHNIFIEFLHNYGVLLGTLFLIILLVLVIKLFLRCKKEDFYIMAVFICIGFVHLIVSGSYLTQPSFFILIGLFMNQSIQKAPNVTNGLRGI